MFRIHVCCLCWPADEPYIYCMTGNFSGVLIFVESQRRPSELISVVFNFVIATQSRGAAWHCTNHDVIDTWARTCLRFSLLQSQICRDLDKWHKIEEY